MCRRFDTIPACDRQLGGQTDGQTDGRNCRSYYSVCNVSIAARCKNLLSSNISSTYPHNMVNFGSLASEIDPVVWGTPANFNGIAIIVLFNAISQGAVVVLRIL